MGQGATKPESSAQAQAQVRVSYECLTRCGACEALGMKRQLHLAWLARAVVSSVFLVSWSPDHGPRGFFCAPQRKQDAPRGGACGVGGVAQQPLRQGNLARVAGCQGDIVPSKRS